MVKRLWVKTFVKKIRLKIHQRNSSKNLSKSSSHRYVDNFGLNFENLKTTYAKKDFKIGLTF